MATDWAMDNIDPIPSIPRVRLSRQEMHQMLVTLKRRNPELTDEDIARQTGQSVKWIQMHLDLNHPAWSEYERRIQSLR